MEQVCSHAPGSKRAACNTLQRLHTPMAPGMIQKHKLCCPAPTRSATLQLHKHAKLLHALDAPSHNRPLLQALQRRARPALGLEAELNPDLWWWGGGGRGQRAGDDEKTMQLLAANGGKMRGGKCRPGHPARPGGLTRAAAGRKACSQERACPAAGRPSLLLLAPPCHAADGTAAAWWLGCHAGATAAKCCTGTCSAAQSLLLPLILRWQPPATHLPLSTRSTRPATRLPGGKASSGLGTNESASWPSRTRASQPRARQTNAPAGPTALT